MVEPVRSAAPREANKKATTTSTSTAAAMKKKLTMSKKKSKMPPPVGKKEEQEKESSRNIISRKQQSSHAHCTSTTTTMEPESPSYRLALKSLFSCRNNHGHGSQQQDSSSRSKKLGCSAPSICKLSSKDSDGRQQRVGVASRPAAGEMREAEEPCKRRASVSGAGASERCVKKPLKSGDSSSSSSSNKQQQLTRCGGSSLSSSSSSSGGGGSFRAGMQLRRLSGCYECHMVVDPISGSTSMRAAAATICPCPDCGEIFVRQESLQLHQSIRHAVCELGGDDTSRNIIEIIFQSSWLKKQSPVCKVERILKVHNTPRTLSRFEEYRDAVKARAGAGAAAALGVQQVKHPRCTADGNELLRFHCAALGCALGLNGATHLCDAAGAGCAACGIIRDGFRMTGGGVRTMATSGRAHDAAEQEQEQGGMAGMGGMEEEQRRAMLVCRVIAGRVKRPAAAQEVEEEEEQQEQEYESVAGSAGVYSNLEELLVFNPRAILPCFVVVYKLAA